MLVTHSEDEELLEKKEPLNPTEGFKRHRSSHFSYLVIFLMLLVMGAIANQHLYQDQKVPLVFSSEPFMEFILT